jgi:lipopolysaccharide/colanic/teichoic acid biosynthesis glycosyltransferase
MEPDDGAFQSGMLANTDRPTTTPPLGIIDLLCEHRVDELIFAVEDYASRDLFHLTALCRNRGIAVSLVPQLYELYLSRSHLYDLDGLPVLQLARPERSSAAVARKRGLDLVLGFLLSLPAAPIVASLAVALYCRRGKSFRWERRCGFRGRPFAMLRLDVDRAANNPSRFERVLGELSLTELPQLWNVLRGEMSLVGPRPESFDRVCRYSEWQQQRLNVKPGMTGLAQVQGLREQHTTEEKTRFDLQYLLNSSLWTDLSLLLQTMWTLATRWARWNRPAADLELAGTNAESIGVPVQNEIF